MKIELKSVGSSKNEFIFSLLCYKVFSICIKLNNYNIPIYIYKCKIFILFTRYLKKIRIKHVLNIICHLFINEYYYGVLFK